MEIRERIELLKTEQESKRLAEAQRRRVRRSQSSNTRSVMHFRNFFGKFFLVDFLNIALEFLTGYFETRKS